MKELDPEELLRTNSARTAEERDAIDRYELPEDLMEAINARGLGNEEPTDDIDLSAVEAAWAKNGHLNTEQKPDDKVTIEKLKLLVDRLWIQRELVAEAELKRKQVAEVENNLEWEIQCILENAGLKRFDSEQCSVIRKEKFSVTTPKSAEDIEAFHNYLRNSGNDHLFSVHSGTLNKWYNSEVEVAMERGELAPSIPGLEPPKSRFTLAVTGKKKKES